MSVVTTSEANTFYPCSNRAKPPMLIVGVFHSSMLPGIRQVCEDLADRLPTMNWPVLTTSSSPGRISRVLGMITTICAKRHRYSVAQVDVFQGAAFIWAEAACSTLRLLRKPYVITLHSGDLPAFARHRPRRFRRLLQSASAVTVPSSYLLQEMKPYRADLTLIPNPLDLSRYEFRMRAEPRPALMWLRAFHERYNPCLAAEVTALLESEFPDVHLTMVGRDKGSGSRQRFDESARALGVAGRVSLPGGVQKTAVPNWLNRGDIFLNTTNVDNTPTSVLEAMACGLCVVSTNVGGMPHLVTHEQDALLVPPNDPQAMAAAVRRILTEPGLAERLSRGARRKAEQCDWSVVLPKWDDLLTSIVSAGASSVR